MTLKIHLFRLFFKKEEKHFTVSYGKGGILCNTLVNVVLKWRDFPGGYHLMKVNFPVLQLLTHSPYSFLDAEVMCAFFVT